MFKKLGLLFVFLFIFFTGCAKTYNMSIFGWPVPEDIHNKILANPDTWEHGKWEYKGQHALMIINDDAKSIRDHTYQIVPVRSGVNMSVNQLKKSFGKITKQIDHPAEVTACALQKYIDSGDTGDLHVTDAIRCWLEECRVKQE